MAWLFFDHDGSIVSTLNWSVSHENGFKIPLKISSGSMSLAVGRIMFEAPWTGHTMRVLIRTRITRQNK